MLITNVLLKASVEKYRVFIWHALNLLKLELFWK